MVIVHHCEAQFLRRDVLLTVAERCSQLLGMVGVNPTWDDNPDFHIYIYIYIYMFSGFETTKYKAT